MLHSMFGRPLCSRFAVVWDRMTDWLTDRLSLCPCRACALTVNNFNTVRAESWGSCILLQPWNKVLKEYKQQNRCTELYWFDESLKHSYVLLVIIYYFTGQSINELSLYMCWNLYYFVFPVLVAVLSIAVVAVMVLVALVGVFVG